MLEFIKKIPHNLTFYGIAGLVQVVKWYISKKKIIFMIQEETHVYSRCKVNTICCYCLVDTAGTLIFRLIEYFVKIGLLKHKSNLITQITFLRIWLCKLHFLIIFDSWASLFIIDPFHNNM